MKLYCIQYNPATGEPFAAHESPGPSPNDTRKHISGMRFVLAPSLAAAVHHKGVEYGPRRQTAAEYAASTGATSYRARGR